MRQGNILTYFIQNHDYVLVGKKYTLNVKFGTALSLINRHYIQECYRDSGKIEYCVNVEIEYGKYLNDKNELIGC
jgi:hypothetical protein